MFCLLCHRWARPHPLHLIYYGVPPCLRIMHGGGCEECISYISAFASAPAMGVQSLIEALPTSKPVLRTVMV